MLSGHKWNSGGVSDRCIVIVDNHLHRLWHNVMDRRTWLESYYFCFSFSALWCHYVVVNNLIASTTTQLLLLSVLLNEQLSLHDGMCFLKVFSNACFPLTAPHNSCVCFMRRYRGVRLNRFSSFSSLSALWYTLGTYLCALLHLTLNVCRTYL
jgi:hypothetical protein